MKTLVKITLFLFLLAVLSMLFSCEGSKTMVVQLDNGKTILLPVHPKSWMDTLVQTGDTLVLEQSVVRAKVYGIYTGILPKAVDPGSNHSLYYHRAIVLAKE